MMDRENGPVPLDRLSDRFFKYLFAREEHKDLLIALLNEVLMDFDPDGSARRIKAFCSSACSTGWLIW